jgi:hypothetical protein
VLRPTFSYDYEYLWEDGSTDSVFAVPFQGVYAVTVTDVGGYGCVNSDSTFVELLFNDAGTDSVLYPISACERGENENPVIRIRNFGNDTIWAGESFIAAFEVIGDTIIKDTFNIAANLIPDQTIEYAFEKTLDFSKDTTYQLRTFTDYSGDTIALNDTTYNSFEVFGYPVVDIGPDTTLRALSYTLNANEGFATYQWSDETTDANLMVNESGKYYVEVYDTNGCPAYDTAHVRLIIRDVMPVSMTSPVNGCVNASQSVSLDVVNTGNDTIYQDDTVKISVFMNQALWGKYDQILQTDFIPDETRQFNLNDEIMFADSGNYSFTLTSTTSLDLIKINDTIYESITINGIPDVEFNDAVNDTIKSFSDGANLSVGNYENYVWSNGQTNPTLVVKEEGWYSVEVEDDNGCEGTGEVFVLLNVVSVDRVADSRNMVFYPNPAVDWLNVTVFPVNHGGKMILEVFTDTGEIVHSDIVSIKGETQIELNVSEYASGLYILRLRDHKTIINKKFIIK